MRSPVQALFALVVTLVPAGAIAQTQDVPNPPALAGLRVACFSPQRAFSESADGKAAIARLTALRDEKARAIDEQTRALQAREQALERSGPLLSDAARTRQNNEVERFRIDVQRFIEDAQAELMGVQRQAENAFVVKLQPALTKVAKDKGLQIVFNIDAGQLAWFDPVLDITAEVVKELTPQ